MSAAAQGATTPGPAPTEVSTPLAPAPRVVSPHMGPPRGTPPQVVAPLVVHVFPTFAVGGARCGSPRWRTILAGNFGIWWSPWTASSAAASVWIRSWTSGSRPSRHRNTQCWPMRGDSGVAPTMAAGCVGDRNWGRDRVRDGQSAAVDPPSACRRRIWTGRAGEPDPSPRADSTPGAGARRGHCAVAQPGADRDRNLETTGARGEICTQRDRPLTIFRPAPARQQPAHR